MIKLLLDEAIVCPGGNCPGDNCPRGELSEGNRPEGNCPGGNRPGAIVSGAIYRPTSGTYFDSQMGRNRRQKLKFRELSDSHYSMPYPTGEKARGDRHSDIKIDQKGQSLPN